MQIQTRQRHATLFEPVAWYTRVLQRLNKNTGFTRTHGASGIVRGNLAVCQYGQWY